MRSPPHLLSHILCVCGCDQPHPPNDVIHMCIHMSSVLISHTVRVKEISNSRRQGLTKSTAAISSPFDLQVTLSISSSICQHTVCGAFHVVLMYCMCVLCYMWCICFVCVAQHNYHASPVKLAAIKLTAIVDPSLLVRYSTPSLLYAVNVDFPPPSVET